MNSIHKFPIYAIIILNIAGANRSIFEEAAFDLICENGGKMQTHEVIFNLNKALQLEYSDVFLYPREAKLIEEKDAVVASTFGEFGLMEVRHADLLARRIIQLGGKPVWDFFLLQDKNDLKDILTRHIDYETKAVDFYGRLVEQVDEETKILLRGIRAEEQVHLDKIKELL